MQKIAVIVFLMFLSCSGSVSTEAEDKEEILTVMNAQQSAWTNGDLVGFMEGYWKNDSLKFYGANGVTIGWDNTLANYKKRYPSKAHFGELDFKINTISKINDESYYVMGEYFLKRPIGDANGIFMIIFKKIDGQWKIIADTSC
jgi:hypothetical protein